MITKQDPLDEILEELVEEAFFSETKIGMVRPEIKSEAKQKILASYIERSKVEEAIQTGGHKYCILDTKPKIHSNMCRATKKVNVRLRSQLDLGTK